MNSTYQATDVPFVLRDYNDITFLSPKFDPTCSAPGNNIDNKGKELTCIGDSGIHRPTRAVASFSGNQGKVFWQARINDAALNGNIMFGIVSDDFNICSESSFPGKTKDSFGYYAGNGLKFNSGYGHTFSTTATNGDIIGTLINLSTQTITFFKNGLILGTAFNSIPQNKPLYPCVSLYELGHSVSMCDYSDAPSPSFQKETERPSMSEFTQTETETETPTPTPNPANRILVGSSTFPNGFSQQKSPTTFDQF